MGMCHICLIPRTCLMTWIHHWRRTKTAKCVICTSACFISAKTIIISFFSNLSRRCATDYSIESVDWQSDPEQENGLLRISEVLQWAPVSTSGGSDPERVLSFQRAWLPLLRVSVANLGAVFSYKALKFLSSNIVVKSTLHQLVKYVHLLSTFIVWLSFAVPCILLSWTTLSHLATHW